METRNREAILYFLRIAPMDHSLAEASKRVLHNAMHLNSEQVDPLMGSGVVLIRYNVEIMLIRF